MCATADRGPGKEWLPISGQKGTKKAPGLGASFTVCVEGLPATSAAATASATAAAATATITTAAAIAATTVAASATAAVAAAATATTAGAGGVAVAAVDGTIAARLEGDLCVFTARGTGDAEHFARGTAAAAFAAFACAPAIRAATRFVGETFGFVEFLFTRGEGERGAAIGAGQNFVGVRHPTTSWRLLVPQRSSCALKEASLEADGTRVPESG